RERKKVLGLIDTDLDRNRFIVFRSLTLLRMMALDPSLVDPEAYADVPSSKLEALLDRLEEVIGDGHRVLLFSQFTSYLDQVASELERREVRYAHLDGSTRDRDAAVAGFREGDAPVFLISLKAGGFGLTLTEADYVFLMDPWWNPAVEAQAIDRAHRIGQTRRVMVYRMVAEDTIEEKVLALQERKAQLLSSVTAGGQAFCSAASAVAGAALVSMGGPDRWGRCSPVPSARSSRRSREAETASCPPRRRGGSRVRGPWRWRPPSSWCTTWSGS